MTLSTDLRAARAVEKPDRFAPEGAIWVCGACGKTSDFDAYGIEGAHHRGWDESCILHAVLCRNDDSLKRDSGGYVTHAEPFAAAEAAPEGEKE